MAGSSDTNWTRLLADDYATLIEDGQVRRELPPGQWDQWRSEIRSKCRQDKLKVSTWFDDPDLVGPRGVWACLEDGSGVTVTLPEGVSVIDPNLAFLLDRPVKHS